MAVGGCQIRAIGGVWKNFPPIFAIASDVRRAAWGRSLSCRMMMFHAQALIYLNNLGRNMREESIVLLSVILNQYYFQLNKYYKPRKDIAMGSSILNKAAEIFLKCH